MPPADLGPRIMFPEMCEPVPTQMHCFFWLSPAWQCRLQVVQCCRISSSTFVAGSEMMCRVKTVEFRQKEQNDSEPSKGNR